MVTEAAQERDKYGEIDKSPWFQFLPEEAKQELARCARWEHYPKGALLHRKGDQHSGVYGIVSGSFRNSHATPQGREVVLHHLEAGMWFGELTLLDNSYRTHDVSAIEDTTILFIPRHCFLKVGEQWPLLYKGLFGELSLRLRTTFQLLENLQDMPLKGRLAYRLLVLLTETYGEDLAAESQQLVTISQKELAYLIGGSRPKVNKVLKDWDHEGIITLVSGGLIVNNISHLQKQANS